MGDYCYQQELRHELKQKSASLTLAESGSAECIPSGGSESEATHKNMYILLFPAASDLKGQCHHVADAV